GLPLLARQRRLPGLGKPRSPGARREGAAMRPRLPLAAFLLLACGALAAWSLSWRPPGRLVVRVDGPDVRVTVAGEGVVRNGEGPCEFELPPGRYEVWGSLNQRPGPEQWVELASGGRAVVDAAVARPLRPARRPFVVLAHEERDEGQYASLAEA